MGSANETPILFAVPTFCAICGTECIGDTCADCADIEALDTLADDLAAECRPDECDHGDEYGMDLLPVTP